MGHWSILSSMDRMEGHTYVVPLPLNEAISAVGYAVQSPGRVVCEWTPERGFVARTIGHTPGWAFLFPVLLFFVRRNTAAHLTFTPVEGGTGVRIHGAIDTEAAMRLRELTTAVALTS